jgi:hypothetical protein
MHNLVLVLVLVLVLDNSLLRLKAKIVKACNRISTPPYSCCVTLFDILNAFCHGNTRYEKPALFYQSRSFSS